MQAIELLIERLANEAAGGGSLRQGSPDLAVGVASGRAAATSGGSLRSKSAEPVGIASAKPGHDTAGACSDWLVGWLAGWLPE